MAPSTFDSLPEGFYVVVLPDDPRVHHPELRERWETFHALDHNRFHFGFGALANRPPSDCGDPFTEVEGNR